MSKYSQIVAMPKVEEFEVRFDNSDDVYFAGQELSGIIILVLPEEKKVDEVLLEMKGKAKTYWTKDSGKTHVWSIEDVVFL